MVSAECVIRAVVPLAPRRASYNRQDRRLDLRRRPGGASVNPATASATDSISRSIAALSCGVAPPVRDPDRFLAASRLTAPASPGPVPIAKPDGDRSPAPLGSAAVASEPVVSALG